MAQCICNGNHNVIPMQVYITKKQGHLTCTTLSYYSVRVGKRRYNIRLWKTFTDCFNCLPVAAILDEKIFCCHGGEK